MSVGIARPTRPESVVISGAQAAAMRIGSPGSAAVGGLACVSFID